MLKKYVLNWLMSLIAKDINYDETKQKEIRYGLEAIYQNVSKFSVIFIINVLLHNFVISLIFILFFIPIKSVSYGFHAKTSLQCWIMSIISFVGLPLLVKYLYFDIYTKIILVLCFTVFFIFLSPADTPKKPIVSKQLRKKLKIFALIILFIYTFLIIVDEYFANIILLVLLLQSFLINPITYWAFNTQYNNYLYYKPKKLEKEVKTYGRILS